MTRIHTQGRDYFTRPIRTGHAEQCFTGGHHYKLSKPTWWQRIIGRN